MRELALVTGASSGIGLELARQFAGHGHDLIVNAEDDELAAAEASLAGIGVNGDFTRDIPLEDDLRLIAVNVTAVVHLAKRVLAGMVERGAGKVLITSSVAATMPGPYYATYAASKAFLQSFAQAVRFELKDTGVTVTALQPGPTDTGFFDRAGMEDTKAGEGKKDDPAEVAKDGFEALLAGKAQVAGSKLLPEQARAALHAAQTKPKDD
jgi:short-subunit dehydrogenase